ELRKHTDWHITISRKNQKKEVKTSSFGKKRLGVKNMPKNNSTKKKPPKNKPKSKLSMLYR
ncbi:MAG: hypothetical protein ACFFD1_14320, partial [Candidatus Thorarchaeota archaeon]